MELLSRLKEPIDGCPNHDQWRGREVIVRASCCLIFSVVAVAWLSLEPPHTYEERPLFVDDPPVHLQIRHVGWPMIFYFYDFNGFQSVPFAVDLVAFVLVLVSCLRQSNAVRMNVRGVMSLIAAYAVLLLRNSQIHEHTYYELSPRAEIANIVHYGVLVAVCILLLNLVFGYARRRLRRRTEDVSGRSIHLLSTNVMFVLIVVGAVLWLTFKEVVYCMQKVPPAEFEHIGWPFGCLLRVDQTRGPQLQPTRLLANLVFLTVVVLGSRPSMECRRVVISIAPIVFIMELARPAIPLDEVSVARVLKSVNISAVAVLAVLSFLASNRVLKKLSEVAEKRLLDQEVKNSH